ncbi:MAG: biotin/lipoate A/B protein ligase family protein [Nitrolancea sp.]
MQDETLETLRVLPFNRAAGAYQLAATEAVIDAVGQGKAPPTLRMYSWSRDSVILGVGQPASQLDLQACRDVGCDVLRRISGGTAVFHDGNTVSFQLVLPEGHPFLSDDIHVNYRRIAEVVIAMLASFGVESRWASLDEARADRSPAGLDGICFSSLAPFEVMANGKKLVGLAQVKRHSVSALQGMLYLRSRPLLSAQLVARDPAEISRLADLLQARTTDLITATSREVAAEDVARHFRCAVQDVLRVRAIESPLTAFEEERAVELERTRYANPEWTFRR